MLNKRRGRLILLLIVFALCLSVFVTSTANAALTQGKAGKTVRSYMGKGLDGKQYKSTNTGGSQPKYTVKVGTKTYTGYCINPSKGWGSGVSMTAKDYKSSSAVKKYSEHKKDNLSYVLLYGYNVGKKSPYGNSNDYYAATQTLVWQILNGSVVMDTDGKWSKQTVSDKPYKLIKGHSYGIKCYDYIKKQMSAHVKCADFVARSKGKKAHEMTYCSDTKDWRITLKDASGANLLKMNDVKGLKMQRDGSKYTFIAKEMGNYKASFKADRQYGTSQSAMVFDSNKSSNQSVALGATDLREFYAEFITNEIPKAKLQIQKRTDDGSSPKGFRFNLRSVKDDAAELDEDTVIKLASPKACESSLEVDSWQVESDVIKQINEDALLGKTGSYLVEIKGTGHCKKIDKKENDTEEKTDETASEGAESSGDMTKPDEENPYEETDDNQAKDAGEVSLAAKVTVTLRHVDTGETEFSKKTDESVMLKDFTWDGAATVISEDYETDENGLINVEKLDPGEYEITEVLSDNQKLRYRQPDSQKIVIDEENREEPYYVVFVNESRQSKVKLIKESSDGYISGISFKVTGKTAWGEELNDASGIIMTTDEKGTADFGYIPAGEYVMEEMDIDPEKYVEIESQKFTVTGDETEDISLTFVNRPKTFTRVSKQDAADCRELPGARLQVIDPSDSGIVREWVSGDVPYVIEGLEFGKEYILKEITAPAGYDVSEQIRFTVGYDTQVVMYDNALIIPASPKSNVKTGDSSNMLAVFLAAILAAVSAAACISAVRRKKRL